jgi:hypothetical protein
MIFLEKAIGLILGQKNTGASGVLSMTAPVVRFPVKRIVIPVCFRKLKSTRRERART